MMIFKKGNLLQDDAEALVNTVNCVGIMGKGIALQFKQAYPDMFKQYHKACRHGEVTLGKMHVVETNSLFNPRYIINFPTKGHWRSKSRIEDLKTGLVDLIKVVKQLNLKSVAIPPIGCGNGGLNWSEVRPLIERAFEELPDVAVHLYEPSGSPQPDQIKIRTHTPKLTRARSLLIMLMQDYSIPGYKLSLLEIQKLAYFLQEVGEPLKLSFVKGKFGPYADNLNHVLERLDGHYIRGFGDRSRTAQIYLIKDAAIKAENFLENDFDAFEHLKKVREIIEGYETPYGLELLSTIHLVIQEQPEIKDDTEKVTESVHKWNDRKRKIFKKEHIEIALHHLNSLNI